MKYLIGFLIGVFLTSIIGWGIIDTKETTRKVELFVTSSKAFQEGFRIGENYQKAK